MDSNVWYQALKNIKDTKQDFTDGDVVNEAHRIVAENAKKDEERLAALNQEALPLLLPDEILPELPFVEEKPEPKKKKK